MAKHLQHITANVGGPSIRHEMLEGRPHIVAPMIMICDGVHAGSDGPLYYPSTELRKNVSGWDGKPVVIDHPQTGSALVPDVLNSSKVGIILHTTYKKGKASTNNAGKVVPGKLAAEAWLDEERLKAINATVYNALMDGQMVEVSTGLYTDAEDAEGSYNGKVYSTIAKNYRPDHLAILPTAKGACSIADGAGLLRLNKASTPDGAAALAAANAAVQDVVQRLRLNELSYSDKSNQLQTLLSAGQSKPYDTWIDELYDKLVIFSRGGKRYQQDYTVDRMDKVSLSGTATEVKRVTRYETLDGTPVVNVAAIASEEPPMKTKQQKVDELIANTAGPWKATDRDWLMGQDDARLDHFMGGASAAPTNNAAPAVVAPAAAAAPAQAAPAAPAQPLTVNQYIEQAPAEMRDMLHQGMIASQQLRAGHIATITANAANTFTQEQLQLMPLNTLASLAKLAATPAPVNPHQYVPPAQYTDYAGAAGAPPVTNQESGAPEPLEMPVINYAAA